MAGVDSCLGGTEVADILIVEDEPSILSSLEFILKHAGWTIESLTDGESALNKLSSELPKAIVLDVMLPRRSGFEVLKEIRANPRTSALPVLVLTAKGQQQDRRTATELGASEFITKPYSNAEVVEAIRRLLSGETRPDAG
ncbi:MAG: response regulator [Hyphomicrobiaceae bacterium]|nr:response regulator [Hyphomicrobiaceae bacterium]MCC0023631.1 response regulator [Hyphomicrobiaceae bacterium]